MVIGSSMVFSHTVSAQVGLGLIEFCWEGRSKRRRFELPR